MSRLVILPLLVPFLTAVTLAFVNGFPRLERALNLASCVALTAFSFWLLAEVDRVLRLAGDFTKIVVSG